MGKSEAWANRIALAKMYFDRGDIKSKPANGDYGDSALNVE